MYTNRNLLLIFCFLIFKVVSSQNCVKYKVIDIDSTKSTYLIKVESKKNKYLIESPKENLSSTKGNKKLIIGKSYKLNLSESSLTSKKLNSPKNVYIDDKKVWSSESDFNLVTTKDLNGLHIAESNNCSDM